MPHPVTVTHVTFILTQGKTVPLRRTLWQHRAVSQKLISDTCGVDDAEEQSHGDFDRGRISQRRIRIPTALLNEFRDVILDVLTQSRGH